MKQSPKEKSVLNNFLPGEISKEGFLGDDDRHIHDIVQDDLKRLSAVQLNVEEVARRLQYFIDQAKTALEGPVKVDHYLVQMQWVRGRIPCPFGEPGMHSKIIIQVTNSVTEQDLIYTQLSVHLIQDHGFFGGKGSAFRLDPESIIDFVNNL